MPTEVQKKQLFEKLKTYKKRYLVKKYSELDESATRLMINSLLTDALGYTELEEIKTEYMINSTYADYVIQLDRKKKFIIEVKAIQIDLSEKHLRQAINYAANEGVDWVILTNGRQLELYKVIFAKPIAFKKVFSFNLQDAKELKDSVEFIIYLTKKSIVKGELEKFWKRFQALEPTLLCKELYSLEVVRYLKKVLKKKSSLLFAEEDILESLHHIVTTKIECNKPTMAILQKKNNKN